MYLLQNCNTCASGLNSSVQESFKPIINMTSKLRLGSFQQPNSSDDSFDPAGGSCDYDLCCDMRLGTTGICQDYYIFLNI